MNKKPIRILSNLPRLGDAQELPCAVTHSVVGESRSLGGFLALLHTVRQVDIVVLNGETRLLILLCLWRAVWPFGRWKLLSLDLVLSRPRTWKEATMTWAKKQAFRRVDRFLLYFKDTEAYAKWYGITPDRTDYVPFKVNIWREVVDRGPPSREGDYVLTAGRSKRDLGTFLAAMEKLEYPGVLLHQPRETMAQHGTQLPSRSLPPNVRVVEDHGGQESWVDFLEGARVVVVATKAETISPSGISTYLDAMALNKCVVATEGPATRGLLTNEALIVAPGDGDALAKAIQSAWEDTTFRRTTAARGLAYAERLQGEDRLMHDIARLCCDLAQ